jgi:hypothetical protein
VAGRAVELASFQLGSLSRHKTAGAFHGNSSLAAWRAVVSHHFVAAVRRTLTHRANGHATPRPGALNSRLRRRAVLNGMDFRGRLQPILAWRAALFEVACHFHDAPDRPAQAVVGECCGEQEAAQVGESGDNCLDVITAIERWICHEWRGQDADKGDGEAKNDADDVKDTAQVDSRQGSLVPLRQER